MYWPTGPSFEETVGRKVARLGSIEGMDALEDAHPLFSSQDLLVTHVFPKLDWEGRDVVELTCKKWRMWWRLRHLVFTYPFNGPRVAIQEWVLKDVLYNNGRDLRAWLEKDMIVYFDGFPLLFKEEEA